MTLRGTQLHLTYLVNVLMGEVDVHCDNADLTWPAMPMVPIGEAIIGVWHVALMTGRKRLRLLGSGAVWRA